MYIRRLFVVLLMEACVATAPDAPLSDCFAQSPCELGALRSMLKETSAKVLAGGKVVLSVGPREGSLATNAIAGLLLRDVLRIPVRAK